MKKLGKCLLWLAAITLYCNIGWGIGAYWHQNVPHTDNKLTAPATTMAKILSGPGGCLASNNKSNTPTNDRALLMFIWPVFLFLVAIFWGFKLVFAGGLVKLVGGLGYLLFLLGASCLVYVAYYVAFVLRNPRGD